MTSKLPRYAANSQDHSYLDRIVTSDESTRKLPPGWASDPLSEFIDEAFGNSLAVFVHDRPRYELLLSVDSCFSTITKNLSFTEELLGPLFLTRSHAAYRTGCKLAMSGQSTESFCILRICLEFALYALRIADNSSLAETWLHRHKDDKSLKSVRREFSNKTVVDTLRSVDPALCGVVEMLYERTIDYGGHPNERSITSNISMDSADDEIRVKQFYFTGDPMTLDHVLKSTAQIGLSALYIFRHIYRERFDILNVTTTMDELRGIL